MRVPSNLSRTLIVFLLIGLFVNPVVGRSSDNSQSKQNDQAVFLPVIDKPCMQNSMKSVLFFQLRVELQTDAMDAQLRILESNNVLSMRKMGETGSPQNAELSVGEAGYRVWINNSQGITATMMVDMAVSPGVLSDTLTAIFTSNSATVNFYRMDPGGMTLIQKVSTRDSITFNLDLSSLTGAQPRNGQVPVVCKKEVWAIYYGWYSVPWMSWSSPRWIDRPQRLYNSEDTGAISRQINQAMGAGIDGFLCEWLGPHDSSHTDSNFAKMMDIADHKNFSAAAYVDFSDSGYENVSEDLIVHRLSYIITTYGSHPSYKKVNGKPLIVVYWTGYFPVQTWRNVFTRLQAQGLEATIWGDGYSRLDLLEEFDGVSIYIAIDDITQIYHDFGRAMYYYPLLNTGEERKIWAASAFPGMDNRPLGGAIIIDQNNGQLYRKNLTDALQSTAAWVFITSWNEYQETTNIEPSEKYGDFYLQITHDLAP